MKLNKNILCIPVKGLKYVQRIMYCANGNHIVYNPNIQSYDWQKKNHNL